jgi:hypothetical protein
MRSPARSGSVLFGMYLVRADRTNGLGDTLLQRTSSAAADAPKRQINSRSARTTFFSNPVQPIPLGIALHDEEASGRKFQPKRFGCSISFWL